LFPAWAVQGAPLLPHQQDHCYASLLEMNRLVIPLYFLQSHTNERKHVTSNHWYLVNENKFELFKSLSKCV
jgi:hypothetical protein